MKIGVIGAGSWGTTISILLAENKHDVMLWSYEKNVAKEINELRENKKYLSGYPIPALITATTNIEDLKDSEAVFFVSPSQHTRTVAKEAAKHLKKDIPIANAAKGLELNTLKTLTEVIEEELRTENIVVLSGPNLSKEIARGYPAATVAASNNIKHAEQIQKILMSNRFRIYTNTDPIGVELGGTLKNVIAIAAGILDGLWLGNNAKSALMVRGITEIMRLGVAMGGKEKTFAGLSGMGDLITTCMSSLSRNHSVGEQIAKGKKLSAILSSMKEVAEGVTTTKAVRDLSKKHKIEMPISNEIYSVLYDNKDPNEAIKSLMARTPKPEH